MRDIIRKAATVSQVSIDHDDHTLIEVKLEDGRHEVLIISDLVRIYNNSEFNIMEPVEIEIGREVAIYTNENTPMTMSIPPRYVPELIVVNTNDDYMSHKFMYFDKELISADNQIQISDGFVNQVESIEYRPLIKELLIEQQLLVFYKASTRSIPAIVNPEKIIIL